MFDRKKLRQQIVQLFSETELKTLCFDLRVDYEILEGPQKEAKVVSLIAHMEKHGRTPNLLNWLADERPNADWQQFSVNSTQSTVSSDLPVRNHPTTQVVTTNSYVDKKTGAVMLPVPAGEFLYGDKKEKRSLPQFWIAKTPVTNAQYQKFIDANPKHPVPDDWDKKTRTYPATKADHPVVYVSWQDARAYATWAGTQLPTEEEWEKAARGTDGRIYPWGDNPPTPELCNFNRHVGDTTPVGNYSPQGDSPYGCVDMSGNVWEWTDSWYDNSQARRVLRGGAWYDSQNFARAAFRGSYHPDFHSYNYGFRVVVRRPPSH